MMQCFSRYKKTNSFGFGFIVHLRASMQQKQNGRFLALFVRFRVLLPIQTRKISPVEGPASYSRLLCQAEDSPERRQSNMPVQRKTRLNQFAGCLQPETHKEFPQGEDLHKALHSGRMEGFHRHDILPGILPFFYMVGYRDFLMHY